ncbi:hypothetical protein JYT22_01055, partial [Endomicrobium sp. AH-315-J14]|nr:hypothetical protein [Endomicrobium sp. AH-315-J14]
MASAKPATAIIVLAAFVPSSSMAQTPPVAPATVTAEMLAPVGRPRPPPLHIDYLSYGLAITADVLATAGDTCREKPDERIPCILGSGGGLTLRGGYRSPGP